MKNLDLSQQMVIIASMWTTGEISISAQRYDIDIAGFSGTYSSTTLIGINADATKQMSLAAIDVDKFCLSWIDSGTGEVSLFTFGLQNASVSIID